MASKYLASLSQDQYLALTNKLLTIQNRKCYICEDDIDMGVHETNIDHIAPLNNKGLDSEENFAVTHESCNKSKQDADLKIAKILQKLKKVQNKAFHENNRTASLKDILELNGGGKYDFKFQIENKQIKYSFSSIGDNAIIISPIFKDRLSGEDFCFIEVPIEYLFHDELINPRGINSSISKLIKEFDKGNPQLHLSLARIDGDKLKIFDGQHKAVAQIFLGSKRFVVRVFISPNIDRLVETNKNAGSSLSQVAFDKAVMRQLSNTQYAERIKKYQTQHGLEDENFNFSEQQLVDFFKGDGANVKKYVSDAIKDTITHAPENKLRAYIDFEGRAKNLPISYSAFDKTILASFLSSKILSKPINYLKDVGENPRSIEFEQVVKILNIMAESVYINKFIIEVGTNKIESKIVAKKDNDITDDHLIAYRMSKEEILVSWLPYLIRAIINYFDNTGKIYSKDEIFQTKFDDQLWKNITNFINNLRQLPLWRDRSMALTVFSGKENYDYWKEIFAKGATPGGVQVLANPLNFVEMIKSNTN